MRFRGRFVSKLKGRFVGKHSRHKQTSKNVLHRLCFIHAW